jgi:predicted O-methyltransferase YrrM
MDLHDALRAACHHIFPEAYLEIGVDGGESLRTVLRSTSLKRAVLCDMWDPSYCRHGLLSHAHIEVIMEIYGVKGEFLDGLSETMIPRLDGQTFDLITVDGDHSESGAETDLQNCWPLLRDGGILAFDDIAHPNYPGLPDVLDRFLAANKDAIAAVETRGKCNAVLIEKHSELVDS